MSNIQANFEKYSKIIVDKFEIIQKGIIGRSGPLKNLLSNKNIKEEMISYFKNSFLFFIQKIPQHIFNILPLILYVVVIPFATFFFLLDEQRIMKKLIGLVPNRYFEISLKIIHSLRKQFGMLLMGMLIDAIIITLMASFGLWMIGLNYPIIVGIFAGVTNLIPYFGPVVGTIMAFIVAIVTGSPPIIFLYVILFFLVYLFFDLCRSLYFLSVIDLASTLSL